jgi:SAM-dependent methyltransferase
MPVISKQAAATASPPAAPARNTVDTVDPEALRQRQRETWASGDFAVIGTSLQIVGETLAEAVDVRAGERVIDIAAGNGNATLAAARRFAQVTSTDVVPALLERGAARARAEGLAVHFVPADAEALPFDEGAFDLALSTFGAMLTAHPERPAREMLLRVVRPGGRIGLANWTPEGFIGQLFKVIGQHLPPPAGLKSPGLWGTEPHIVELFGPRARDIRCERRHFQFRYASPQHWLQVFRQFYGPMLKAFAALDAKGQALLAADITALLERLNCGGAHSLVVPGEYLEVVIHVR